MSGSGRGSAGGSRPSTSSRSPSAQDDPPNDQPPNTPKPSKSMPRKNYSEQIEQNSMPGETPLTRSKVRDPQPSTTHKVRKKESKKAEEEIPHENDDVSPPPPPTHKVRKKESKKEEAEIPHENDDVSPPPPTHKVRKKASNKAEEEIPHGNDQVSHPPPPNPVSDEDSDRPSATSNAHSNAISTTETGQTTDDPVSCFRRQKFPWVTNTNKPSWMGQGQCNNAVQLTRCVGTSSMSDECPPPVQECYNPCYRRQRFDCCTSPWAPTETPAPSPLTRCKVTESPQPRTRTAPTTSVNYDDREQPSTSRGHENRAPGTLGQGKDLKQLHKNNLRKSESLGGLDMASKYKGSKDQGSTDHGENKKDRRSANTHSQGTYDKDTPLTNSDEGTGTRSPPKERSHESLNSLGLPPIKRKIFPYYPKGLITPVCRPADLRDKKKKKKSSNGAWTDALKSFYDSHNQLDDFPGTDSDLNADAEGRPSKSDRKSSAPGTSRGSRRKTAEETEAMMRTKMRDLQSLFGDELKELTQAYERLKEEPNPIVGDDVEAAWEVRKRELHAQMEEAMANILNDIKSTHEKE